MTSYKLTEWIPDAMTVFVMLLSLFYWKDLFPNKLDCILRKGSFSARATM
jgi:hypothetical protein